MKLKRKENSQQRVFESALSPSRTLHLKPQQKSLRDRKKDDRTSFGVKFSKELITRLADYISDL